MGFGSLTWSRMLVLLSTLNADIPCTFILLGLWSAQLAALMKEVYVDVSPSILQLDNNCPFISCATAPTLQIGRTALRAVSSSFDFLLTERL
ncbi:uncharacterized protein HD556DRAFT_1332593 [Suillus plorans]|uniref:Uncharacterized protein n=1 Tax=Suillus plorans TaxID=116603 RepID=A0A9P7DTW2_9AGAM|nr:uncharacterized protein HD556DRAFT_1332593 [Suillus plorans]KAG1802798.1 hypothetical protein HD556DRAFT_1332593 [Suillus plorans]